MANIIAAMVFCAAFMAGIAVAAEDPNYLGEPVAVKTYIPRVHPQGVVLPIITAVSDDDGESICLRNGYLSASLRIDKNKHIRLTSIKTDTGTELLAEPAYCFDLLGPGDKLSRGGREYRVINWHSWQHSTYAEAEIMLDSGQEGSQVVWHLRLYRDKPYLEQWFELPKFWRIKNRVIDQHLNIVESLRPVMPTNILKHGFEKGVSKVAHSRPFEFVPQSEHLVYDADNEAGLAVFVAGAGGEELLTKGNVELKDGKLLELGDDDSPAHFLLFPFSGPVEKGFWLLRKFISSEYCRQGDKISLYTWNQFWLWQGPCMDWCYQEVTSERLMDILPYLKAMGVENFHLDAGWEEGMMRFGRDENSDWQFDPNRFPGGFVPIKKILREYGMAYSTHMNCGGTNRPDVVLRIIRETDLDKLFIDQAANSDTLACMRQVRQVYPDFEVFSHSMYDSKRESSYWKWGNLHWLSDFEQVYFGEGTWRPYLNDLPKELTTARFIDLFTRTASYQATWVWPYKTILTPHAGFVLGGQDSPASPAHNENKQWNVNDASSLILTTIAARYVYGWGEDPRLVAPETLKFFMDWTAFWKVFRPFIQEYQHILTPPDGIHPDGAAHIVDGKGFMVVFNPSPKKSCTIPVKDLLWSTEAALELEGQRSVDLSDWTNPLEPKPMGAAAFSNPSGEIMVEPNGYFVLGINLDVEKTLVDVKAERAKMNWPPL